MPPSTWREAPMPEHIIERVRQQRWQTIRSGMGPDGYYYKREASGELEDDLPIVEPDDFGYFGPKPGYVTDFESACEHGDLPAVQAVISSKTRTPAFLHNGLLHALRKGNIEIASCLLAAGAPIVRKTPEHALWAPVDQQFPLFELLIQYGWTPNTPGYYGNVLLPRVVTNIPLLRLFLDHGANPNLGEQRQQRDQWERFGASRTDSCRALERAAAHADIEAVRMLLDAGAKIENGTPLHSAAGAYPPGTNPYYDRIRPTEEFDTNRIPVMKLLVELGADVNQRKESRHMIPGYAIVYAVIAGAVERVRWLLEHGANPELEDGFFSAVRNARMCGSEEMKQVIEDGLAARRWTDLPGTELAHHDAS